MKLKLSLLVIYQIILKILAKNKNLILSKNREHNTCFSLAANSGCNVALRIMLEYYSIEYDSDTYKLISEGVADMHCRSDEYLADELIMEYESCVKET